MTETSYHPIDLEQLVRESHAIVRAVARDPAMSERTVELVPPVGMAINPEARPFNLTLHHLDVVEILKSGKDQTIKAGVQVDVAHANAAIFLEGEVGYYYHHEEVGHSFPEYEGLDGRPEPGGAYIVFVKRTRLQGEQQWEYAVYGARLPATDLAGVKAAILRVHPAAPAADPAKRDGLGDRLKRWFR